MSQYAIRVIASDWELEQPLPFSEEGYQRWRDEIEAGTRVVLYQSAPVNAIVAEGQVSGIFVKLDEWPESTRERIPGSVAGTQAAYALPLQILYRRGPTAYIPLEHIREHLDENFPESALEWLPIEKMAYHEFTRDFP
jgi:hypothetical protein